MTVTKQLNRFPQRTPSSSTKSTASFRILPSSLVLMIVLVISSNISSNVMAQDIVEVPEEAVVESIDQEELEDWEEADDEAAVMGNPFGIEPANMLAAKKFQLTQIFAVEAEVIARVCELDKKQAMKLKIGMKGAVKKLSNKWVKDGNAMGMMGMAMGDSDDEDEDKEAEAIEEVVINDADEIDEMTLQMLMMNGGGNPFSSDDPRDSKFWKKVVSSVLTDEQAAKFKQHQTERAAAKRKALTDSAIASITAELGLSVDQIPKLDAIVRPVMVDAEINCHVFYEPYILYYYASKADGKELKKLLSPAQLQQWKLFVAPSKQIGQMMEMEDGMMGGMEETGNFMMVIDETLTEIVEGVVSLFDAFAKQD